MLTDGKGEKGLDKRYLNLFGPNDFMTEEFNYRYTGWSESQFCKLLMGHSDLYRTLCALYVLTRPAQACLLHGRSAWPHCCEWRASGPKHGSHGLLKS